MNTRNASRKPHAAAFTLIELLVVIAIISILTGLLLPVIGAMMHKSRCVKATSAMQTIVASCSSYLNEYGRYPSAPAALIRDSGRSGFYAYGDVGEGKCAISNDALFDILRAIDRGVNSGHSLNRRRVSYIGTNVATARGVHRDGFCDGNEFASDQGRYLDPWGGQYCVVLSADASEPLDMSRFYSDLTGQNAQLRKSVVVFSMGVDGTRGESGVPGRLNRQNGSQTDDLVSWKH